jgi:hypothetical protein
MTAVNNLKGKLFVYNYQYRSLSGFENSLAELMFKADSQNQKNLLKAYPHEMQAVMDYQTIDVWWEVCVEDVHEYYINSRGKK